MKLLLLLFMILGQAQAASTVDLHRGGSSIGFHSELYKRRGELKPPPDLFDLEELNRVFFSESRKINQELKRVKYYLINGELRLASVFLSKLAYRNTRLRPVIYRYLAILNFIEADYRKSLEYLRTNELKTFPHYGKVCTLRVLNQIILNVTHDLRDVWDRCKTEGYAHFIPSNMWWLEVLIDIKLNPRQGITKVPFRNIKLESFSIAELKIFLKLAIYLNQEQMILNEIPALSVEQLQDTEVRELIGHIFFRTGQLANAYKYVDDLKSPNSENIKGNLYVLRGKYELAYAQFRLALEQKQNSQNAMERLLPLAWLLGDWAQGAEFAERIMATPETLFHKMTLAAAFNVQKGSFEEARNILDTITQKSRRGGEIDVTQLYSFASLMQNLPVQARKYASLSCALYDLTNCWVLFQLGQWDTFPIMIRREDKISHQKVWEKLSSENIEDPLKETVYVNQLDIEELDDKLIRIIPQETK